MISPTIDTGTVRSVVDEDAGKAVGHGAVSPEASASLRLLLTMVEEQESKIREKVGDG